MPAISFTGVKVGLRRGGVRSLLGGGVWWWCLGVFLRKGGAKVGRTS